MSPNALLKLKGAGYLVSTLSVFLLALVSWANAQKSLLLTICLITGAATSIVGMFCRWITYQIEKNQRKED